MQELNFIDVLESCDNEKHIVLGNGFGLSYDAAFGENKFSWHTLLELCEIEESSNLHSLLEDCSFDFELAHQKINSAIEVVSKYSDDQSLIESLQGQVQELREQLIIAVSNSHPDSFVNINPFDDSEEKIRKCRDFISIFEKKFSLNYDLLLYWIRCYERPILGKDSFGRIDGDLIFKEDDDADYFFPHGALFLTRDGISAIKTSSSSHNPILARTEQKIRSGHFPMCVSEGTGQQKKKTIMNNEYLRFCYQALEQCEGTIFTFGCSFLGGKDDHIIEAMIKSPADKIVVGEYNPTEETYHRLMHEFTRVKGLLRLEKEVVVANTATMEIW